MSPDSTRGSQPRERAHLLAARAAALAGRAGRPDLQRRAGAAARRVSRTVSVAVVAGDHGAGKSSLVNALTGTDACPVDPIDATTVVTMVRHGHDPAAVRLADDPPGETRTVARHDLPAWLTEGGNPGNVRGVEVAEIAVPSPLLGEGLALVDTPGSGGLHPMLVRALTSLIPSADAVILVLDAGAPPTPAALEMLDRAAEDGLRVLVALTKVDIHPEWRAVAAATSRALRAAGISAPVIPLAVPLVPEPDSGIAGIAGELRRLLVGPARRTIELAALASADAVARQLASAGADADAEHRLEMLAEGKRRWAAMLQEGFSGLMIDIDGELRAGLVRLGSSADDLIGSIDPLRAWPEVRRAVDAAVADLVRILTARLAAGTGSIATEIAGVFGTPGALEPEFAGLGFGVGTVAVDAPRESSSSGRVSRSLEVLRGSYGGIVLAGALGQLAALPVVAPLALGAGAMFGARQLAEQRRRRTEQRRIAARRVVRTHLDESGARLAVAVRKAVQAAQRDLRDRVEALVADLEAGAHDRPQDVSGEARELVAAISEARSAS